MTAHKEWYVVRGTVAHIRRVSTFFTRAQAEAYVARQQEMFPYDEYVLLRVEKIFPRRG